MDSLLTPLSSKTWGIALALALGFLIGRTREPAPGNPPRPGIRDFLIISALGAACALIDQIALTTAAFAGMTVMLAAMRLQRPERTGITTELAALATFAVGYMTLTPARPLGAALGIILAVILATKGALRAFAREIISDVEYLDTLGFLALIFLILPILPVGAYGPFGFFEPRKIWMFVILVCGVSYVGYFLMKFLEPARAELLSAVVGGIASTTAYTGGASEAVREVPESAVPMARATLIANSIMFPRMLILAAAFSPVLAASGIPAMGAMMAAGLVASMILGAGGRGSTGAPIKSAFQNPFSLYPALRFGLVFAMVLFLTRAGTSYFGGGGELVSAAIGGLIDTDAVTVSLAQFHAAGASNLFNAVVGMVLAAAVNALFKSGLAYTSRQPRFFVRVATGFAIMFAAGAAVLIIFGVPTISFG